VNEEPTGLFSIGEFARRSKLSISALRFYGDCGVLAPARIDSATGYRYYSAAQLREAELLRHLRALEMPIAEIQSFLTAEPAAAESALDSHWRRLERRFNHSRRALGSLQLLLRSKEDAVSATTSLDGNELARGVRQVLAAAGPLGQDHHYPAAVLIELREDGLRLVGTDGHRLAVRDLPVPTTELGRVVIAADDAERLASMVETAGAVTVTAGTGLSLRLTQTGEPVSIRAASDHYPDYEAVLDRCGSSRLLVGTADFIGRLNPGQELVVLKLTGSATTADGVAFSSTYEGDDLDIGFNPAFLADAMAAGIGPDAILQLGSPVDPVAIRSADGGTLTWLVMPVRLTEPSTAT
jgi:DNA polymerase III subunit beta